MAIEETPAAVGGEQAASASPAGDLRRKAVRGSAWVVFSYGVETLTRLASGVLLRRLLPQEVFGVLYIVESLLRGLGMFSDFGLQAAIVQHKAGEDRAFLDTAWTIQVARGAVLCLVACVLAWPISLWYEQPPLLGLLCAAGLTALIAGFNSTSLYTAKRSLAIGALTFVHVTSLFVQVGATLLLAWWTRSYWALVLGPLLGTVVRLVLSYIALPESRNWFAWDPDAARSLFRFGIWILLASGIGFVSSYADGFILGKYLGMAVLGSYMTALRLIGPISGYVVAQTHKVLYPVFCRIHRDNPATLSIAYYRVRLRLDMLVQPAIGALMVLGPWIVGLLFGPKYADAGWMLQLLCIRSSLEVFLVPCETCLFSLGLTRYGLWRNLARAVWVVVGAPLAYEFYGLKGIVWVAALSEAPVMLVLWPAFRREGFLNLRREALGLVFLGVGALVGLALSALL